MGFVGGHKGVELVGAIGVVPAAVQPPLGAQETDVVAPKPKLFSLAVFGTSSALSRCVGLVHNEGLLLPGGGPVT